MSTKVKVTTIKQAIDNFLLSCKVEGKSYGSIECYTDASTFVRAYNANDDEQVLSGCRML